MTFESTTQGASPSTTAYDTLVAALRHGDPDATRRVSQWIGKSLSSHRGQDLNDKIQAVWEKLLKLWQNSGADLVRERSDGCVRSWLRRVATSGVSDWGRVEQRQSRPVRVLAAGTETKATRATREHVEDLERAFAESAHSYASDFESTPAAAEILFRQSMTAIVNVSDHGVVSPTEFDLRASDLEAQTTREQITALSMDESLTIADFLDPQLPVADRERSRAAIHQRHKRWRERLQATLQKASDRGELNSEVYQLALKILELLRQRQKSKAP